MTAPRPSVARVTQKYIREHPSIADCLDRGLVNYSALAREICAEHKLDSFDAVVIACRRYFERRKPREANEQKVTALIRHAKVRVRNKIAVVVVDKLNSLEKAISLQKAVKKERGDFNLIEGEEVITIITNTEYVGQMRELFGSRLRRVAKGLVQITMIFDQRLETTPGVVSYIYRLFAENSINIREEMSCWTDVMVVVDENDAARAMQILSID